MQVKKQKGKPKLSTAHLAAFQVSDDEGDLAVHEHPNVPASAELQVSWTAHSSTTT